MHKNVVVPVSRFVAFRGYYQIGIINHYELKLEKVISPAIKLGEKIHSELEEEDKLIPWKEATKEELKDPLFDLDIPMGSLMIHIKREKKNIFGYLGRLDKVIRERTVWSTS